MCRRLNLIAILSHLVTAIGPSPATYDRTMSEELLWARLHDGLTHHVRSFPGVAGVHVRDLTTAARVSIQGDVTFPTASMIKMHILAHLLERAEAGDIDMCRRVSIDDGAHVLGSGVLAQLDHPAELTVQDVAVLMIVVSDNSATNLCIDWATMHGTNDMSRRLGLTGTLLRRKMSDRDAIERGDENVSTPDEMAAFLDVLHHRRGLSPRVCDETLRILRKPKHGYLAPGLPEDAVLASKAGGMGGVRGDAAIVYLERRPYAVCAMTKYGLADRGIQERFVADAGRMIHEHMRALDRSNAYGLSMPPASSPT